MTLQRFWHAELPKPFRTPFSAYARLLILEQSVHGEVNLVGYDYTGRGVYPTPIPDKVKRKPAPELFDILRWNSLVAGFAPKPGPVRCNELDSGSVRCELIARRRAALPHSEPVPLGDSRWRPFAAWPKGRRMLVQIDPTGIDVMSFADEAPWDDWEIVEREIGLQLALRLRERVGYETPRMLIDATVDWANEKFWLLDLLAHDGRSMLGHTFSLRQSLLAQEYDELVGIDEQQLDVRLWTREPADDKPTWVRTDGTYAALLVTD